MAEINKIHVFSDISGTPKEALVDSQRRVVVVVDGLSQQPAFIVENTNVAVPGNVESTIVSYTVPGGSKFRICGWSGTGTADARYILYVNNVRQQAFRTSAAMQNVNKSYSYPIEVAAGLVVAVKVTHGKTPVQEFSCTIEGFLL